MFLLILRVDINLLVFKKLQFSDFDGLDVSVFQLFLDIEVIALVILLQPRQKVDKILQMLPALPLLKTPPPRSTAFSSPAKKL